MSFSKFTTLSITVAAALCLASCKDYVGKETTHPFYQQAETAKANKDFQSAIDAYKNFMKVCPESAKVHYDIAIIYADNMRDYENAISHFQTYLDMSRETITQDARVSIQNAIETCKKGAFNQYRTKHGIKLASDLAITEKDIEELPILREKTKGLISTIQEYDKVNKELNAEKAELVKKLNAANQTIRTASAKNSAAKTQTTDKKDNTTSTVSAADGQRYYTVVKGDGLQSISKKVYNTARYASLIEKANKDKLGERGILKIGQKLVIPAIPE